MKAKTLKSVALLITLCFVVAVAFFAWQAKNFEIDASADTLLMKDNKNPLQVDLEGIFLIIF